METRDKKIIDWILSNQHTATGIAKWEWVCPHCGHVNIEEKFTKHAKYRLCNHRDCGKGVMVCLSY